MFSKLLKLANQLDKLNFKEAADEIDSIFKKSLDLTPEKEQELDKKVDEYFADPDKQVRNKIEQDYQLDQDDMFGLEPSVWNGYEYSYEGVPVDKKELFKDHERYHTVIAPKDKEANEIIQDSNGIWELQGSFDAIDDNNTQLVYKLVPDEEYEHRKERVLTPESEAILNEVEATELPEDTVSIDEKPAHGGGIKLF